MSTRTPFPRSNVLVVAYNSIHALLPTTLIDKAEAYLEAHKIDDAIALADAQRKRLEAQLAVDAGDADALSYVHQRIGFQCMAETRFEEAGYHLFEGDVDPRLLVSYFPDLRGSMLDKEDGVEMFEGVAEAMVMYDSVDDVICADLVRNYSPHLAPNTRSAPPSAELRRLLNMAAYEMIEVFLRKWRRVRGGGSSRELCVIVDTVLAKLFCRNEKTTDLYALINEQPNLVLHELEPTLISTGQYNALCNIYQKRSMDESLLEAWAKIADGEWSEPDIPDPINDMITLLLARRKPALTQKWAVWIAARDPERGLKLLTMTTSKRNKRASVDADFSILSQIRAANPEAGIQFLEHLVLQKRSSDPALHTELAFSCVDEVLNALKDEATAKLWRAKASSYASSPNPSSFFSYFASTTPDSATKRARLRAMLFLQNSSCYDAHRIRERFSTYSQAFPLECSIVEGKLGNDRAALSLLTGNLRDRASAEAYCIAGRRPIPPRVAREIAERNNLSPWTLGVPDAVPAESTSDSADLVKMLLDIYVDNGNSEVTASLLSSQAAAFDVTEVLERLPGEWSLSTFSTFIGCALRRTLHDRHEAALVKGVAMGQNLMVTDETHAALREEGFMIEEAVEGEGDEGQADEKALPLVPADVDGGLLLSEKAGIHIPGTNGRSRDRHGASASWDSSNTP